MNIAFDAKRAFHNTRGLGNYSRDTMRLMGTYYPENNYYLFNPKAKKRVEFALPEHASIITPQSIVGKALPSLWRSLGMRGQLITSGAEIYHGLSQELPYGIQKIGIKSVVTMHDAIFMRYPELYPASYRAIFIQKNRYACRVADSIIAISEQTKRDIIQYFGADESKISVVYQGCNNIFRAEISQEKMNQVRVKYNLPSNYLLNVGAIEKRKNVATIIAAICKKKIETPLVVIGAPTKYLEEVKQYISAHHLEKQVQFIHHVATEDLPAIYKMAEIFIYPSVFEGFGIPILEALCTGTPVISTKGSCFEETGGKFSSYVAHDQAEEMGEEILRILGDQAIQKTMREQGLLHAENFKDEVVARNLMQVYKSLF